MAAQLTAPGGLNVASLMRIGIWTRDRRERSARVAPRNSFAAVRSRTPDNPAVSLFLRHSSIAPDSTNRPATAPPAEVSDPPLDSLFRLLAPAEQNPCSPSDVSDRRSSLECVSSCPIFARPRFIFPRLAP